MKAARAILTAAGAAWCFLAAGAAGPALATPETTVLREGDSLRGLSGRSGSENFYRVQVPSGVRRLEVLTSGGEGDCDLYVRQGGLPSMRLYDARSDGEDTRERIALDDPRPGNWYILLRGDRAYWGVTLAVRLDRGGGDDERPVVPLTNNVPARDLSAPRGSWRYFSIRVPPGSVRLTIRTGGGRGDCDLYVSRGVLPTPKSYGYVSSGESTEESIAVPRPEASTWYILLHGSSAYAGVDLVAGFRGGPPIPLPAILEPGRGTVWRTGEEYPVRWRVGAEVRRVQVQYSLDGGETWTLGHLPRVVEAEPGVMAIRVLREKRFVTEEARVRVLDFDRQAVLATSASFRIVWGEVDPPPPPPPLPPPIPRPDRYEPDNDADSAGLLRLGTPQTHTIFPRGDQDWLEFYPSAAGRYVLRLSSLSVPLEVTVWSVSRRGEERHLGRYDAGRAGGILRMEAQEGTRYLRIRLAAQDPDGRGAYTINATED